MNTSLATALCIALSLGLPLLIAYGLGRLGYSRRTRLLVLLGFAAWLGLTGLLAARGLLADFKTRPPRLMLVLLPPLLLSLGLSFHPRVQAFLATVPMAWLIGFQAFRLPVEIFLWLLAGDGVAPPQMTFEGRNWDILTGLTALPAAWAWTRMPAARARIALGWNLFGLALLLNIVTVAILSMPTPWQQLQPANTFVAWPPFVWLPALLVPLAYSWHFFALRQLWLQRAPRPAGDTAAALL